MLGLLTLLLIALVLLLGLFTALLVRGALRPPRHTAGYAVARGLPVDPADARLQYSAWTLDRPDGARLPVWEIAGDSAAAHAETVVLLHGWGESMIDLLPEAKWWAQRARRVVLYDLRGHGDAEGDVARLGDPRDRDDLLALLERIGEGPFILAGRSSGATVAMHAAAAIHDHDTIRAIVASGTASRFITSLTGRLRVRRYPVLMATLMRMAYRLRGIHPIDAVEAIGRVRCPMLLLHARDDCVVPLDDVQALARAHSQVKLHVMEGGEHVNLIAIDATGIDHAVDTFLAGVS